MAISRLTGQDATGTSSTTSVNATYASTPTSGNLLIAVVGDNGANAGTTTITGWTRAITVASSTSNEGSIFYKVSNGAESTTVTANNSDAGNMEIAIYEYTGFTSPVLDKTSVGSGSGTTCGVGTTATTTDPNELLIVGAVGAGGAVTSPSWSNSYSLRNSVTNVTRETITGDQIVAATSAYTSTVTWTGAVSTAAGIQATFKSTASAGSGFNIALV